MKAIRQMVLAVALVLTALGCRADYLPFLEEGKWWIVAEVELGMNEVVFCHWKVAVTDVETIDSQEYFNLSAVRVDKNGDGRWVEQSTLFPPMKFRLSEKNGTVYLVDSAEGGSLSTSVLFSLEEFPEDQYVVMPTTVKVNEETRAAVYFGEEYVGFNVWIVEGIGPNSDYWSRSFATLRSSASSQSMIYKAHMMECYKGEQLLYTRADFDQLAVPVKNN